MAQVEIVTVTLTYDERSVRALEAANLNREIASAEELKKEVVKEHAEKIAGLKAKRDALSEAARTGSEERPVKVDLRPDNERLVIEYFDITSGEKVRERPMTHDETIVARQSVMPFRNINAPTAATGTTGAPVTQFRAGPKASPLRGQTQPPINPPPAGASE